jgi:carboxymethylenebutenolidase
MMTTLVANGTPIEAVVTPPPSGSGSGVLFLHAWWGLTPWFRGLAQRVAAEGFVIVAPDLMQGRTAETVDAAKALMSQNDEQAGLAAATAGLAALMAHPQRTGARIATVGYSMGVQYGMELLKEHSGAIAAEVSYYGHSAVAWYRSLATGPGAPAFLLHCGDRDEWEPMSELDGLQAPNITTHVYPGAGHWFAEENRPDVYDADAAALAWHRTVQFLREQLR